MAAAMLSSRQVRLLAVAALVALMCTAAVAQGPLPAIISSAQCKIVDKNAVSACFKSFGEGKKNAIADRVISGKTTQVALDCCVVFGGHDCLCQMKKAWAAQGNRAPSNVQCVRDKPCN